MKEKKENEKKVYEKPQIKSDEEAKEYSLNCPTTNVRHCGTSYSPKKG